MLKKILLPILVLGILVFVASTLQSSLKAQKLGQSKNAQILYTPIVVLELFTSQGCSSCPPADMLLDKVKRDHANVIVLSFHVDYWNSIGWEDPFSKPEHSQKQKEYNKEFNNSSSYTPQLIVNGREHFVGSDGKRLRSAINNYGNRGTVNHIVLSKVRKGLKQVSFEYNIAGQLEERKIRALLVLDKRKTSVKRGENRDRILTNNNIVVSEKWIGPGLSQDKNFISIPEIVKKDEKVSLILLVQKNDYEITAASKAPL